MAQGLLTLKAEAIGSGRLDISWPDYNIPLYLSFRNKVDHSWQVVETSGNMSFVGLLPGVYQFQLFSLGRAVSRLVEAEVKDEKNTMS